MRSDCHGHAAAAELGRPSELSPTSRPEKSARRAAAGETVTLRSGPAVHHHHAKILGDSTRGEHTSTAAREVNAGDRILLPTASSNYASKKPAAEFHLPAVVMAERWRAGTRASISRREAARSSTEAKDREDLSLRNGHNVVSSRQLCPRPKNVLHRQASSARQKERRVIPS